METIQGCLSARGVESLSVGHANPGNSLKDWKSSSPPSTSTVSQRKEKKKKTLQHGLLFYQWRRRCLEGGSIGLKCPSPIWDDRETGSTGRANAVQLKGNLGLRGDITAFALPSLLLGVTETRHMGCVTVHIGDATLMEWCQAYGDISVLPARTLWVPKSHSGEPPSLSGLWSGYLAWQKNEGWSLVPSLAFHWLLSSYLKCKGSHCVVQSCKRNTRKKCKASTRWVVLLSTKEHHRNWMQQYVLLT